MSELPLVSIGIASYNNAPYLEQLLDSIRDQTYSSIELIIVDDCSPDNSVEVIKSWAQRTKYPLQLVVHKNNEGITRTFSECRKLAKGKYLSLVGSDDVLGTHMVEEIVREFEQQGETCGVVYSDCQVIDSKGDKIASSFLEFFDPKFAARPPEGNIIIPLLTGFYLPALTATMRCSALNAVGPYDESLFSEDLDMWLRLSRKFRFVYLPANLGSYRVHNASAIHANKLALNETYFRIYRKGLFEGEEEWKSARRNLADHAEHYYASQGPEAPNRLWYAFKETHQPKIALFWLTAQLGIKYTAFMQAISR